MFSCIAALGQTGCGFEHQFASVLRALGADGQAAPAENQGFLRADALLAIVMVTNEDDCSARAGVPLDFYDTSSNIDARVAASVRPPDYRCNEFGHLCDGVRPPRMAPNGQVSDTVTLQNCTSSECDGVLTPVAEFAARIKALKAAPASEIVVAAITGPATPYQVHWSGAVASADTSVGRRRAPGRRSRTRARRPTAASPTRGFASTQLGRAPSARTASCRRSATPSFGPALQQIATRIGTLLTAGGGTRRPAGPIPSCAVTGARWRHRCGRRRRRGGAGGAAPAAARRGSDAAGGHGRCRPASGCGCQAGGAAASISGRGRGRDHRGAGGAAPPPTSRFRNTEPRVIRAAQPPPGRQLDLEARSGRRRRVLSRR